MHQNLIIVIFVALTTAVAGRSPPDIQVPCPTIQRPVCGQDGHTYYNDCMMRNSDVGLLSVGSCPVCPIPKIWAPVCGEYGYTYANKLVAECLGVKVVYNGYCKNKSPYF